MGFHTYRRASSSAKVSRELDYDFASKRTLNSASLSVGIPQLGVRDRRPKMATCGIVDCENKITHEHVPVGRLCDQPVLSLYIVAARRRGVC